jgi:tetratricopeptide (TPR) repeat protein
VQAKVRRQAPDREARTVTRSDERTVGVSRMRGVRSICTACGVLALVAFVAGCGSARRDLPSPRLPDADALRAEAAAAPQSAEPLYQLALLQYGDGEPEPALESLRQSLRREPLYAPSLALLAKLLHDAGRSAEALAYFKKLGVDTLPEPVRLNVALLYADVGNTVQARKLLQGLASGAWADAALVNLAYLDLVDEDAVAARKRLEGGLGAAGDAPEAINNRALAELRAGDVESGARRLKELAAEHPELGTAQLNLALLLRHYLFDPEGADRAQAHFDALGAPKIGDAAWQQFIDPAHEDASPAVPKPNPAPAEEAKP